MSYRHFVENPAAGVDPGPQLSPGDQQLREEELEELLQLESIWA